MHQGSDNNVDKAARVSKIDEIIALTFLHVFVLHVLEHIIYY